MISPIVIHNVFPGFSHAFLNYFFMFLIRGIKSFQEEFFDNTNEEIVGMFDFLDWNEDKGNPENLNGDINKTYTQGNYLQISYRTLSIIRRGFYIVYPHFYCSFICRAVSTTDDLGSTKKGNSSIFEP